MARAKTKTRNPTKPKSGYQSYLLRLWQEPGEPSTVWRASLESPQTGKRQGFSDLASLVAFLEEQTGTHGERPAEEPGSR